MANNVLKPLSQGEALYNGRIKLYPCENGEKIAQTLVCDKAIFNPFSYEKHKSRGRLLKCEKSAAAGGDVENDVENIDDEKAAANFERSVRRARAKVYDLVMCNTDFSYFVTLTISPESADRTDYNAILKKLNVWLDNRVRGNGLKYVLVPEYHPSDNVSIHFHGFFNDVLKLVDSGHKTKKSQVIYNLPQFKMGFTTAIKITGSYTATCRYILKYIGKQREKIGGRFYLSGGDLQLPRYEFFNGEFNDVADGYTFAPQGAGVTFRVCNKL